MSDDKRLLQDLLSKGDHLHIELLSAVRRTEVVRRRWEEQNLQNKKNAEEKKKRIWIQKRINRCGEHGGAVLLWKLAEENLKSYMNALRMNIDTFRELLRMIQSDIQKQGIVMSSVANISCHESANFTFQCSLKSPTKSFQCSPKGQ